MHSIIRSQGASDDWRNHRDFTQHKKAPTLAVGCVLTSPTYPKERIDPVRPGRQRFPLAPTLSYTPLHARTCPARCCQDCMQDCCGLRTVQRSIRFQFAASEGSPLGSPNPIRRTQVPIGGQPSGKCDEESPAIRADAREIKRHLHRWRPSLHGIITPKSGLVSAHDGWRNMYGPPPICNRI
jgi:hypothetical protein